MADQNNTASAQGEPAQMQQQSDLAGFNDPAALANAYRNSSTEARRQKERADQLEQMIGMIQQRPDLIKRQPGPEDELETLGIPIRALEQLVQRQATEVVQKAFEPIQRGMTARNSVMAQYPDFQKFESDVFQYLQSDPQMQEKYNRMFNADPEGAMDYAFLKFGEAQRRRAPQGNGDTGDRGKKTDAQIPSSRSAESRSRTPDDNDRDTLQRAYKAFRETGNPDARDAYVKTRLKGLFSEGFFKD